MKRQGKKEKTIKEVPMSTNTLDSILEGRRSQPHMLIEVLLDLQDQEGYLPEGDLKTVSKELGVPLIDVYRVANFYKAFSLKPRGKNVITICTGTACHVRGSQLLVNQVKGQLGIEPGDTTADGQITVECVNCLGACALGPIVVHNESYCNHMTPGKLRKKIDKTAGKKETKHA
jgi:NADH:ubiquinone oxidoreductase subunit E